MIAIGSDHAGYALKEAVKKYLGDKSLEVKDFGTFECAAVDYPDVGVAVANSIVSGECERGIIICGTGIGISIAANKVDGIRAALCTDSYMARMAREHNDANILALGARVVGEGLAQDIVDAWLGTAFAGGRHKLRVDKIMAVEQL